MIWKVEDIVIEDPTDVDGLTDLEGTSMVMDIGHGHGLDGVVKVVTVMQKINVVEVITGNHAMNVTTKTVYTDVTGNCR